MDFNNEISNKYDVNVHTSSFHIQQNLHYHTVFFFPKIYIHDKQGASTAD